MGSIQKRADRPDRPWRARYRAPDGRERARTFVRKVDAERWLRQELGSQDRGDWVDPRAGAVTLEAWAEQWLAGLNVKPKTLAGYESLLRSRVLPTFGELELRQITTAKVRAWLTSMGEELAPARIRQARQVLHAALAVAVDDGVIARNPCDRVKAPTVRPRRQRFLTATQLEELARSAEQRREAAGALVRLLGWSGLRWGEAVALRRQSIDVKRRRIRVREAMSEVHGSIAVGSPKTHETRTVIVPRFAVDAVAPLLAGLDADDLVFTAPAGGPLRHSNFRSRVWRPAVDAAAGVPDDLLIHDLRDTAAALMIASGASIKAVQRALGHASASMTLDVYGGLFEDDLEDLADRMESRFGETVAAPTRPSSPDVIDFPSATGDFKGRR